MEDPTNWWFGDPSFTDLEGAICAIFSTHSFTASCNKKGSCICGGATDAPDDNDHQPILPKDFAVSQNYSNPFNLSTVIHFSLPRKSDCFIEIYNILGQKVWENNMKELNAGEHDIILNDKIFDNLASGTYLYRIISDLNESTKKMILLK